MTFHAPPDVEIVCRLAAETRLDQIAGKWTAEPSAMQPAVISVMRNERGRIDDFLRHYRALGVRHFAIIDNASTDGTRERLAAEPDILLFESQGEFDWRRKHGWVMHLIEKLGRHRWYLLCDADEHCVFGGRDTMPLSGLVSQLERLGRDRARGALVDMYCEGPMVAWARPAEMSLPAHYRFFDAGTYREHRNALLTSRTGGPRQRVMGHVDPDFRPELTKYPLFRLGDEGVAYNPHVIWPPPRDADDPCLIGILHYKFDGDLFERLLEAVKLGQYWNASAEYAVYLKCLRVDPGIGFFSYASQRYEVPDDLLKFKVIEGIQTPMDASTNDRAQSLAGVIATAARRRRAEALLCRPFGEVAAEMPCSASELHG